MKHLKIIGLALVAAAAFMAFAGNASAAPTLTCPTAGTTCTGTITATAGETLTLKAGFANDTCTTSTVSGSIASNTEAEAKGGISTLSYSGCTLTTTTLKNGELTILPSGEVFAIGNEVTVSALGTSCVYGGGASPGTKIGTLTGGTTASLAVKAQLPKISGGFACANPAEWTGKYTVTTPDTLLLK